MPSKKYSTGDIIPVNMKKQSCRLTTMGKPPKSALKGWPLMVRVVKPSMKRITCGFPLTWYTDTN
jgi:hypothetical protein